MLSKITFGDSIDVSLYNKFNDWIYTTGSNDESIVFKEKRETKDYYMFIFKPFNEDYTSNVEIYISKKELNVIKIILHINNNTHILTPIDSILFKIVPPIRPIKHENENENENKNEHPFTNELDEVIVRLFIYYKEECSFNNIY